MKTEMVLLGAAGAVIALVVVYTMMGTKKRDREEGEDDEPEVAKIVKLEVEVSHLADEAKANAVTIQEAVNRLPGDNPKLKEFAAKGVALATGTSNLLDNLQEIGGFTDEQRKAASDLAKQKAIELAKKGGTKVVSAAKNKIVTWWNNRKK
jgi:hypothetical protein